jgi:hypothetical protein
MYETASIPVEAGASVFALAAFGVAAPASPISSFAEAADVVGVVGEPSGAPSLAVTGVVVRELHDVHPRIVTR